MIQKKNRTKGIVGLFFLIGIVLTCVSHTSAAITEFRVNTYVTDNQIFPSVALDQKGNFIIAWISHGQDGNLGGIYAQRFEANGNPLGNEFRVNSTTVNDQSDPAVAIDGTGRFLVAWASNGQDGDGWGVYAQRFEANGQPLGAEFRVNSYTNSNQWTPVVALDNTGAFIVAWESRGQDGDLGGIYARRFEANGQPLGNEFRVNSTTVNDQSDPAVAIDGTGRFLVAWASNGQDGDGWGVYAQRFEANGQPLGAEFRVNTYISNNQQAPAVAIDDTGSFVIAWESTGQDGDQGGIYARRFEANGQPLGTEFQVNTVTANDQSHPTLALNGNGSFVIAWHSFGQDNDLYGVYTRRYDSGGNPLGAEFQVNTYATNLQMFPSLASDGSGNFFIAWQSFGQDGSGYEVYAQRYNSNGNPIGSDLQVNTTTLYGQQAPSAALDQKGNTVIAWRSDSPGVRIYAQRHDSNGNPLGKEFRVNTYIPGDKDSPSVAIGENGQYVIAWESRDQDGDGYGIFAQRFDHNGNPLGNEFQVNTYTAGGQTSPSVAMDEKGRFVIVWGNGTLTTPNISAKRFDTNGTPLGGQFQVDTYVNNSSKGEPSVAMSGSGQFVIAWESYNQDGDGYGIFARRFDPNGNPLGNEFQVNTHTAHTQGYPSAAMDDTGSFVIAWESDLQENNPNPGYGVYAQRYNSNGVPLGVEFQVNTYTTDHQQRPSAAMDRNGRFVIAWESYGQDGDGYGIFARSFDRFGNPLGGEFRVNTYTTNRQRAPSAAMNQNGNLVIAWQSFGQDGSYEGVFMKRYYSNLSLYLPLILK